MHRRMMMQSYGGYLSQNVVAYYKLDGNPNDFFGRLNGLEEDNVNYTTGLVGQAYDGNNGVNSLISIPDNDLLSFTDGVNDLPFSFSIWLNFANTETQYFFSKGVPNTLEYQFLYLSNGIKIILNDFRNNSAFDRILFSYPFTPSLNTWYHFVFTYDGSATVAGVKGYIDSVAGGSATIDNYIGMVNNVGNAKISRAGETHWDGQLDELVIFNKELNQQEVTDIYNKGLAGEPLYT